MSAGYETLLAKQTGLQAVKSGWTVSFCMRDVPDRFIPIMHAMHRAPCALIAYPYDPDDLFSISSNGELNRKKWTPSQAQRMAITRLWIAKGCPGTKEEHYNKIMEQFLVYIDSKTAEIENEKEAV